MVSLRTGFRLAKLGNVLSPNRMGAAIAGGLGPETMPNWDFATDLSGWADSQGQVTWDAGRAKVAVFETLQRFDGVAVTEAGKTYQVDIKFHADSDGGGIRIRPDNLPMIEYTLTDQLFTVVATDTTTRMRFERPSSGTGTTYIESVSVKEVL